MTPRKPNFIDKLPSDKKSHLVLGLLINPPIIIGVTFLGNYFLNDYKLGFRVGCLVAILCHIFIEIHQKITKTGKAELLDALAGIYSIIVIWVLFEIILKLQ